MTHTSHHPRQNRRANNDRRSEKSNNSAMVQHVPRALAVAAALACSGGTALAAQCDSGSTDLTQGACTQGPTNFTKPDPATLASSIGSPASPFTTVQYPGTSVVVNPGTISYIDIANYNGNGVPSYNTDPYINYAVRQPGTTLLFNGNPNARLFAASLVNQYSQANIDVRGQQNQKVWASYVDLQMTGNPGVRGTYSIENGTQLVLDNVRLDQTLTGGAGHLGVVSERGARSIVQDSSVVMNGPGAVGVYAWAALVNSLPSSVDATRTLVATFGDDAGGLRVQGGSTIRVTDGSFFSQGSNAKHAYGTDVSKVYVNGSFMASGVLLGNTRVTGSWLPVAKPNNFFEKPDWTTYGLPIDTGGLLAGADGRDISKYQPSAATNSNAVRAFNSTETIWLDRDAAGKPNVIHMFGANTNHALLVNGSGGANLGGTINSRGTQITTHSPDSAGAKVDTLGTLRIDDNTITTLADNSPGLWATGAASALSTPYKGSTIITAGANSHAVQANNGAVITFDTTATASPATYLPIAGSKVSGAGAAVLAADGVSARIHVKGPQSLDMGMTPADTTGASNWGALATNSAMITFSGLADSGGTALKAGVDGTLLFDGDPANPADAAGSRVILEMGTLSLNKDIRVRIGSLEGDVDSTVQLGMSTAALPPTDKAHLVIGPDNSTANGSRQRVTTYAGAIQGDGAMTVSAGHQLRLATRNAAKYYGKTTVGGTGLTKALPADPTGLSILGANTSGAFSSNSDHVVLPDGWLDMNGFNQIIQSLDNAGVVSFISGTSPSPSVILETVADYISNGGTLVIGTQLGNDASPTNVMVVQGGVNLVTPTKIDVQNINGLGDQAPVGIPIIKVNGASSPAGAFVLAHPVAVNGITYYLKQVGQNWHLLTVVAPVITAGTPGNGQGVLTIDPPANLPTGVTVSQYNMTCTPTGGGTAVTLSGTSPLTMTGLTNGTNYDCVTTATLSDGNVTPQSNVMPLSLQSPPVITAATPGNGQATLTITPPGNIGSLTVTDYTMTCTPAGGGAAVTATGTSPLVVPGMTNGTTYNCTTVANLSDGSKSLLSNSMAVTPPVLTPSITQTTPGDKSATVTLAPPANLPTGVTVTNYTLTCTPANGGAPVTVTGASPIALSGLTNDVVYTCTTIANLSDGKPSAVSAPASFTPKGTTTPTAATPVPTLSQWSMALMSMLTVLLGALGLRRRRD